MLIELDPFSMLLASPLLSMYLCLIPLSSPFLVVSPTCNHIRNTDECLFEELSFTSHRSCLTALIFCDYTNAIATTPEGFAGRQSDCGV